MTNMEGSALCILSGLIYAANQDLQSLSILLKV